MRDSVTIKVGEKWHVYIEDDVLEELSPCKGEDCFCQPPIESTLPLYTVRSIHDDGAITFNP